MTFIGGQIAEIGETKRHLRDRLSRRWPIIGAEVVFAMQQEYAFKAVDVIARRTRLAFLDSEESKAVLGRVLDIMAAEAGWDAKRRAAEEAEAIAFLATMNRPYASDDE